MYNSEPFNYSLYICRTKIINVHSIYNNTLNFTYLILEKKCYVFITFKLQNMNLNIF